MSVCGNAFTALDYSTGKAAEEQHLIVGDTNVEGTARDCICQMDDLTTLCDSFKTR